MNHLSEGVPKACVVSGEGGGEQANRELELKVGQIVKITHIIDKDWYR